MATCGDSGSTLSESFQPGTLDRIVGGFIDGYLRGEAFVDREGMIHSGGRSRGTLEGGALSETFDNVRTVTPAPQRRPPANKGVPWSHAA